jgi:hypothetical protein
MAREEEFMRPATLRAAHAVRLGWLALALLAAMPASAADLDLALYAKLLARHTEATAQAVGTRVDYAGLRRDPQWRALVANLESTRPSKLASRDERLAFWINAYNILAIRTVAESYPVDSIRDLGSWFSPVWKREAGQIEGRGVTLHEIEHAILRKMGEPRIHAAIVCASTSCPSLVREPYVAAEIDSQLDATMGRWLADRSKGVRIDRDRRRIRVSRIFKWFADDFEAAGGVRAFIALHLSSSDRAWLASAAGRRSTVEYFDYDWSLNDWPRDPGS